MNTIKLLALDFDGVIADSILECAVSGKNGFNSYSNRNERISSPEQLNPDIMMKFRAMRPFIRNSEDYVLLFQALEEGFAIASQNQFDQFHLGNRERKEDYHRHFVSERKRLLEDDLEGWLKLNPLFDGIAAYLSEIMTRCSLYIVSTKGPDFIRRILTSHGVAIDSARIHQAGRGMTKGEIVQDLVGRNKISISDVLFVDDHVETCARVSETGVETWLAKWGYNTNDQLSCETHSDVRPVELDEFRAEIQRRSV